MSDPDQTPRDKAYDRNDNMKVPPEGEAPGAATEPRGSEGSSKNPKTATNPSTGEPNSERKR